MIRRILKQLLYGLFYLIILGAIGSAIYLGYFRPEETCFDNKQNQGETGIDCGGPCVLCELRSAELIHGDIQVLPSGEGRVTLVTEVESRNSPYDADIDYVFKVFGAFGEEVSSVAGKSSVGRDGVRYIIAPGIQIKEEDISRATFDISGFKWLTEEVEHPYIVDIEDLKTATSGDSIKISGGIRNKSYSSIPAVRVSALVFDKDDSVIGASFTRVINVQLSEDKMFTIFFPEGEDLINRVDNAKTKIFWEVTN